MNVQPKRPIIFGSVSPGAEMQQELQLDKKHPRSFGLMFLIMNTIEEEFWMEKIISWSNWKVPNLISINSVCSMLYTEWPTDFRRALAEEHHVWYQLASSQDREKLN